LKDGGSSHEAVNDDVTGLPSATLETALARLAGDKSSEVNFALIIDNIITKRLNESGLLNASLNSNSGNGAGGGGAGGSAQVTQGGGIQSSLSGGGIQSFSSGGSGVQSSSSGGNGGVQSSLSGSSGNVQSSSSSASVQSLTAGDSQSSSDNGSSTKTTTDFHRFRVREFKIANGSVGVEGSLDYADLIMQMKEGLSLGYSKKEVMSGVIRATKPGCELRKYFVRKGEMSYEDFKQTLREFYQVRESDAIMDEMREMVQGEGQDLLKYVMSMCALRDEALEVSATEECPPGEARVMKRFVDSTLSGLLKPTVRLEMQEVLKLNLPDPKLFKEVRELDKRVRENEKKVGGESQTVTVKAAEASKKQVKQDDKWKQDTAAKLDQLTTQVSKLEALFQSNKSGNAGVNAVSSANNSMDAKIAGLLGQVQQLTAQMQEYQSGGGGGSNSGKFKFRKCDDCERAKKFCRHCRKCKQEGHKESDCTEN
jgi:hypothetical protein